MGLLKCLSAPFVACYRASHPTPRHDPLEEGQCIDMRVRNTRPQVSAYQAPAAQNDTPLSQIHVQFVPPDLSPTSSLVLNWAGTNVFAVHYDKIWATPKLSEYMRLLGPQINKSLATITENPAWKAAPPGVNAYGEQSHIYRKAIFMRQAEQAIAKGYKQIVLVANGYNPMVVALAERHPDVRFFCSDYDKTVVDNCRDIFRKLDLPNVEYALHNCAVRGKLSEYLYKTTHFDTEHPAYCQLEGLTYYLTADQEKALLDDLLSMNQGYTGILPNAVLLDMTDQERLDDTTSPCSEYWHDIKTAIHKVFDVGDRRLYYRPSLITNYDFMACPNVDDYSVEEIAPVLPPIYKEVEPRVDLRAWTHYPPVNRFLEIKTSGVNNKWE